MLTFKEFPYERPQLDKMLAEAETIAQSIENAKNAQTVFDGIKAWESLQGHFMTMANVAHIRYTVDTTDPFYLKEKEYLDQAKPRMMTAEKRVYATIANSSFAKDIDEKYGPHYLNILRLEQKLLDERLVEPMIEENRLAAEYQKRMAACQVECRGEVRNIYGLLKLMQDDDRAVRKEAFEAWAGFFAENQDFFDDIYDRLVKLRHSMAKTMGYENFIPIAYMRKGRSDYGPKEVARFREQVLRDLVPLCNRIRQAQAKRIGVDKLHFYDETYMFATGNPMPKGNKDELVQSALEMYRELSPETGRFFGDMVDMELFDLESKPGKANGGYCTFLPEYKMPFIFSNFNGTSADVNVLTHENGHAFMGYESSRVNELLKYRGSTSEVAEIHSMSMEFFTHPYMEKFFGDQADKYCYAHIADSLIFVPYGVCVDEFQHRVYENPDLTPKQRRALWRDLERKYLPHRDYDGNETMENGAFWFKQLHIFLYPFYYIDYTLASMGAFAYYGRDLKDHNEAWQSYLKLCRAGGSKPYLQLLKLAGLDNPFEEGSVRRAIEPLEKELNKVDDSKL